MPVVSKEELASISLALAGLSQRVGALTMPVIVVPPATESGDGAQITAGTGKLVIKTVEWELTADGKLKRNGQLRPESGQVNLGMRDKDTFVQGTSFGGFYRAAGVEGNWTATSQGSWTDLNGVNPRSPVIPPPTGVPAPAAEVGYNTRTLGPAVTLGGGAWVKSSGSSTAVQNADGSVSCAGPWTFNDQISTLGQIAFGDGGYFEATFKFDNAYAGANGVGWPSWWANTIEGRNVGFPNQRGAEVDFAEFWATNNWGAALHDWYGGAGDKLTQGTAGNTPAGQTGNQVHKYGCRWVPATPSTKGRLEFYFDRVLQPKMTIVWDLYVPGAAPPYAPGTTAGASLDVQHLWLMLGTGAPNPMTIYSVEVWQKSAAGNILR